MKLKEKRVLEVLNEIAARVAGMQRDCPEFCRRANDDSDSGVSGVSYGGSRSSGHGDPVGDRAGRRDRTATQADQLWKALLTALDAVRVADRKAWALLPMDADDAKTLTKADEVQDKTRQRLMAQCANPNCDHWFSGMGNDRPRGGRCNACRMYLDRNPGQERPRHLCAISEDATSSEALGLDMDRVIVEDVA